MRVAVVHDWLTGMRGGEKVLEGILELLPSADLYTLFHFPGTVSEAIESHRIHTSPLQRMAARAVDYRRLLPLFPFAAESWDLSSYDLVISSSHCVAHGVRTGGAPHASYCHTPMRYIWDRFDDYFPPSRPAMRFAAATLAPFLRRWDQETARGVDLFIANSRFVAERIRRLYAADARVVHPFVDDEYLESPLQGEREDFHLIVSALVPYKRIELAIAAANASAGSRLVVVGRGPMEARLKAIAGPNVTFVGYVPDEGLRALYGRARSLILPGVEDFGITCLEAMASGTPVLALREGGALDSVVERKSGIFFDRADVDSLLEGLRAVESGPWDRETLRQHARGFSRQRFLEQFSAEMGRLT